MVSSERSACKLLDLERGSYRYEPRPDRNAELREALITMARGALILLHTLAHLLITTISLECGYPASSVRERVYAMPGLGYELLLYTGSSDVEGTPRGLGVALPI